MNNEPTLKFYPESIIRHTPSHVKWCESTEEIWEQIEPIKEFCYVGKMTLNELFLFFSQRGKASEPFLRWWNRNTIKKHIHRFFKQCNNIYFGNIFHKRFLKLASIVKMLQDLPIRNQISGIVTNEAVEIHPGGTRLALKDFYDEPVPVFLYSKLPLDILAKINKQNIKILNEKSSVRYFNDTITITPPIESYGVRQFHDYPKNQYRKTNNKVIVDNVIYFLKQNEKWIINPELPKK